jgi:predicted HD phosphohydrolase
MTDSGRGTLAKVTASERFPDERQVLDETEALLRSLHGVWDEEAVDDLDHGLQAATRAIEDGADDELVLAAALHDLAHSPLCDSPNRSRHDVAAREWLTPRYGARVGWLAGAHVAAKRYLVATDPGYGDGLSPTSVLSLAAQGGPADEATMVSHPWWPDALRLRHYDDAAKVPGAPTVGIEDLLAVAQRVLQQNSSQ